MKNFNKLFENIYSHSNEKNTDYSDDAIGLVNQIDNFIWMIDNHETDASAEDISPEVQDLKDKLVDTITMAFDEYLYGENDEEEFKNAVQKTRDCIINAKSYFHIA